MTAKHLGVHHCIVTSVSYHYDLELASDTATSNYRAEKASESTVNIQGITILILSTNQLT